jgi:hypothetical protein
MTLIDSAAIISIVLKSVSRGVVSFLTVLASNTPIVAISSTAPTLDYKSPFRIGIYNLSAHK